MLSRVLLQIAAVAGLASALTIRDDAAEVVDEVEYEVDTNVELLGRPGGSLNKLDWKDVKPLVPTTWNGKNYGCKCAPGQTCWPSTSKWSQLNSTVGGRLSVHIPPGAACYDTFTGPLGSLSTYDEAKCAEATAQWGNETWTVEQPAASLWTYWTNETCRPTDDRTKPCTLGFYGVYVIKATTREHVKAGIDFARKNNIRLVIRNTGHDFEGRSTGWGSLIINTHSFQNVEWINNYSGPGSYNLGAVKIGAGVQGRSILTQGHARNPPVVMVTGECPTVGVAGGFIQGGGHGPWTTLKGFSADNVLSFDVVTASGVFTTANAHVNPDLFHALKGGGPASYAVILSMTVKTFPDVVSSGAELYLNTTHFGWGPDGVETYWKGVTAFHKWSNHIVDSGLYAYFEMYTFAGPMLRVRPFVGIGKTAAELDAILRPMLDEFDALNVPYEYAVKQFPTFYDLYIDMFEDEQSGQSALAGGWMFDHTDVAERNDEIIDAFKVAIAPRPDVLVILIGHLFNPGHGMPVSNSATHPAWRNATNFIITTPIVPVDASWEYKMDIQNVLTWTMDEALRNASTSGCTYVNEADPYQPNWGDRFWGSEYPGLQTARAKWDPKGVFYAVATPGTEDWEVIDYGTRLCKVVA
ncbi:hypothetical protein QBC34DRAFT_288646 [Podospora aff. communis PSN243]|uniref:FAD-binding PCMH-type domain-containing protein n=1 Tax=Podospora aff. communis PSN243 TaxID=3040156 RepID=A0AAV9H4J3_9PEZI|nr:hypothetical protein QBC34DRAFT_288646 [Podospora aff. communis PSN243]